MTIKHFLLNLILSLIWVALTGVLSYPNFIFGYLLGFGILWVLYRNNDDKRYFTRVPKITSLIIYFIYEMLRANIQVAYEVITPKYNFNPGIVRYPMSAKSDIEINLLTSFISLTPGTLVLDVSEDRRFVYIHVMYLNDKRQFLHQVRHSIERRILEVTR